MKDPTNDGTDDDGDGDGDEGFRHPSSQPLPAQPQTAISMRYKLPETHSPMLRFNRKWMFIKSMLIIQSVPCSKCQRGFRCNDRYLGDLFKDAGCFVPKLSMPRL